MPTAWAAQFNGLFFLFSEMGAKDKFSALHPEFQGKQEDTPILCSGTRQSVMYLEDLEVMT
jgi:hypothetical protein